jgi:CheY-like chemotaxis protein
MQPDSNHPYAGNEFFDPGLVTKKNSTNQTGGKQEILHIDDDPRALQLVSHILGQAGFTVVSANSGFEALTQFRQRPYDFNLVLLDLTMPFMDGEETFARLREIRPDVRVVLCTGFIQHERLAILKSAGLTGFLRKPIPPNEIVGFVKSTLASARYSSDHALTKGAVPLY